MPGDTLEVEIHSITLVVRGYIHIPNTKEGISTKFTRNGHEKVKIDAMSDGRLYVLNNEKILPANPMIGVIGVAIAHNSAGDFPSTGAGDFGGNMDNSLIKPEAKVYLREVA